MTVRSARASVGVLASRVTAPIYEVSLSCRIWITTVHMERLGSTHGLKDKLVSVTYRLVACVSAVVIRTSSIGCI